jgi:DNA-binding HxlR family transcriptional regulator
MSGKQKSDCPINLALEVVGDRWTLLIVRDMMFAGRMHFREFLSSEEGMSSRTLADRLLSLQQQGLITRHDDPTHGLKTVYRLTAAGVGLLPVLVSLGVWGSENCAADRAKSEMAVQLNNEGPAAIRRMQKKLLSEHMAEPG